MSSFAAQVPQIQLVPGVTSPIIGFGTSTAKGEVVKKSILDALQVGYKHIDTAERYEVSQFVQGMSISIILQFGLIEHCRHWRSVAGRIPKKAGHSRRGVYHHQSLVHSLWSRQCY